MFARLLAEAVPRSEDAAGVAGGCPQSVESAVLLAFDASRTTEACFLHRIFILYRKSLFFTPNASENASRTPGSLFEHGTHIPYHRRAFPVPSPQRQAAAAAELRTSHTKKEADHLVDLLLHYTVMSHVSGMLRKR